MVSAEAVARHVEPVAKCQPPRQYTHTFHVVAPEPEPADDTQVDSHAWRVLALCAQTDPEAFFPEKGGSTREAKRVCLSCEVRVKCLDWALANNERFGIWGGLSERERRRVMDRAV